MDKPTLLHQELLTNLSPEQAAQLPDAIKTKIASLDKMLTQYEAAPSPATFEKIELLSGRLWHEIKDFLEKDLPDEVIVETVETPATAARRRPGFFKR